MEIRIAAWEETLAAANMPTDRAILAPLMGLDGRRVVHQIAGLAGAQMDDVRAEAIDRASGEAYTRLNRAPQPLPGVARLIAELDRQRISWAIATSSRKAQVRDSVSALGLRDEPMIIDASHVRNAKPDPELLLLAARQLGVEPVRCWYVGDSTWDMLAAVAAGMIAIGVTTGSAVDAVALAAAGSAAVVETLDDLAAALEVRTPTIRSQESPPPLQ